MFNQYESQMMKSIDVQLHADTVSDKVKRFIANTEVSAEEAKITAIIGVVITALVYAASTYPIL
jgi:hypothetical protein